MSKILFFMCVIGCFMPEAQDITTKVHYSPLPASTVKNAKQILKTITYNGQPILK